MSNYNIKQIDKGYVICDGQTPLYTKGGNKLATIYKPIADRLLKDLNEQGYEARTIKSILSWHFTTIDLLSPWGKDQSVEFIESTWCEQPDWTCEQNRDSAWHDLFGSWSDRSSKISMWLSKATIMQLSAIAVIANEYESVNLAFELARIMESYPKGDSRDKSFEYVAKVFSPAVSKHTKAELYDIFKLFELYYGIHLDSDGIIIGDPIKDCLVEEMEVSQEDNKQAEYSIRMEMLVGRNYYHYTDGTRDNQQPLICMLPDISVDESNEDEEDDTYCKLLPANCWVKRFVDDEDPFIAYLSYLIIDDNGMIEKRGCITETSQRLGGGGLFFMLPGIELPMEKSYSVCSLIPDKVEDDYRLLISGKALPLDYSFIGKRLPQKMIDEGGNGGSITDYTYALQSAYRLAYMHMSISTTKDGVIEDFDYSTYQSSGSSYGDLFSRPVLYSDRKDEAMDMLLYLYDMYTEKEL